nr:FAD binding domain protein [uncultured bacterium]
MDLFYETLKQKGFEGEIDTTEESRQFYSHDASLFELMPQVVVFPKANADLERLVSAVNECRDKIPGLSMTARSAGTDMSGAAVGESIIIDFTRHFNQIEEMTSTSSRTQPGVLYRIFEKPHWKKVLCCQASQPAVNWPVSAEW